MKLQRVSLEEGRKDTYECETRLVCAFGRAGMVNNVVIFQLAKDGCLLTPGVNTFSSSLAQDYTTCKNLGDEAWDFRPKTDLNGNVEVVLG